MELARSERLRLRNKFKVDCCCSSVLDSYRWARRFTMTRHAMTRNYHQPTAAVGTRSNLQRIAFLSTTILVICLVPDPCFSHRFPISSLYRLTLPPTFFPPEFSLSYYPLVLYLVLHHPLPRIPYHPINYNPLSPSTYVMSAHNLFVAACDGHAQEVHAQLLVGAPVNFHEGRFGYSPLSAASVSRSEEDVKLLIASGADVEWADKTGNTPLLMSAVQGRLETVHVLLAAGANIEHKNERGETALNQYTLFHDMTEAQKALIEAGADIESSDSHTALLKAAHSGRFEKSRTCRCWRKYLPEE